MDRVITSGSLGRVMVNIPYWQEVSVGMFAARCAIFPGFITIATVSMLCSPTTLTEKKPPSFAAHFAGD